MPTFNYQAPDGRSFKIDARDLQHAIESTRYVGGDSQSAPPQRPSMLSEAATPVTSIPSAWREMNSEAMDTARGGASEVRHGMSKLEAGQIRSGLEDAGLGAGKFALGELGVVTAPADAAIDSIVGRPVLSATGSPVAENVADTAASLFLPIPKGIPRFARAAEETEKAAQAVPTEEQLFSAGRASFNHPSITNLGIKSDAVKGWAEKWSTTSEDHGFDENTAPTTTAILNKFARLPDQAVTGVKLQGLRETLGNAAAEPKLPDKDRLAATRSMQALDQFILRLPKEATVSGDAAKAAAAWKQARGNWAAAERSKTVSGQVERAELNAASANSGQNIDNATRQQIKRILQSPKLKRGFSAEELAQMKRAVVGTFTGDAVRYFSNVLGKGGGLGTLHAAATGGMAGGLAFGPVGAVAGVMTPAIGYGLAKISNSITAREVKTLQQLIRSRSPLAQQMRGPLETWSKASVSLKLSPTPRNIARFMLASRNLSNNLKDAGISVSPEQLVGSAQNKQNQKGVTITEAMPVL
jgi:hypothetical protein